jgi:antitoxin component YwqK of YwqJK toxin-antitoxin module
VPKQNEGMKRTLLFALTLIAVGCADPIPRNLDDLSRQGIQYQDPETLEPYSGPAYRVSEDDPTQIVLRVNLRDGRFHGNFKDFDPERVEEDLGIYQTGTYRDGLREGRSEYFYPSGVLRGRGTYKNSEVNGTYESYYENGELRSKSAYVVGELDGPFDFYYENGQLQLRGSYTAGERHGPTDFYYEDGQLRFKGIFDMGEECGTWIEDEGTRISPPPYELCPPGLEDGN